MSAESETTKAPLLTRADRKAAGKALRDKVSRESHAGFVVDPARNPIPILTASDSLRVQSLVPERYKRMGVSPFTFYRGAAALMAHDLVPMPRIGLPVQACGDCHLMNFGVFSSPEGNVLFDINDFDETYPGLDFIVDLKRLAASVAVAAQDAKLPAKKAQALARSTVAAYRDFMSDLADRSPLEVWQTRMDFKEQLEGFGDDDLETKILAQLGKSEKKKKPSGDHPTTATKDNSALRFVDKPPFLYHVGPDGQAIHDVFNQAAVDAYQATLPPERGALLAKYALHDAAFKVVGVGSVGTLCAVGLLATADGEQIILQLKQSLESVVAKLGDPMPPGLDQGQRVVDGQRALQAASDFLLGWMHIQDGRQFYFRQAKNRQLGSIAEVIEGSALEAYAALCGRTLARGHARTGDPAMIAGYIGENDVLDDALATFSMAYAAQNKFDHEKLVASGLIPRPVAAAA